LDGFKCVSYQHHHYQELMSKVLSMIGNKGVKTPHIFENKPYYMCKYRQVGGGNHNGWTLLLKADLRWQEEGKTQSQTLSRAFYLQIPLYYCPCFKTQTHVPFTKHQVLRAWLRENGRLLPSSL
jgi:hypothetical protein